MSVLDFLEAAALLEQSPDHRVLRRFVPRTRYNDEPWNLGEKSKARVALFVDVEATGLNVEDDEIIELGIVPFTYDAETGIVYDVLPAFSAFEQPRAKPISDEITAITGITNAMVEGQRIDDAAVQALIDSAAIVFAHNADYDRRMLERRFAGFAARPFACTQLDERTALSLILDSARQPVHRVCALRSPMRAKDLLRGRGYRALYDNGFFAYWYKDVRGDVGEEVEWCKSVAAADPYVREISAHDRYSTRADR